MSLRAVLTNEERADRRLAFHDVIAPAIAAALTAADTASWTVRDGDPDDRFYRGRELSGSGGERVYITIDEAMNRIDISGIYGQTPDGRAWVPRDAMTSAERATYKYLNPSVSADKSPALIARDIVRRFLPKYREYVKLYRMAVDAELSSVATVRATVDELIRRGQGTIEPPTRIEPAAREITLRVRLDSVKGISHLDLRVSQTSVELRGSVSLEFARQLATTIGGLK